jgi:hypothetical protein
MIFDRPGGVMTTNNLFDRHRSASPLDLVIGRLDGVRGAPPKLRARCPAHGSKSDTLAIREMPDGKVLLRCHAGCSLDDVLHAAGLWARDLFPDHSHARQHELLADRRRFAAAPEATVLAALDREIARLRERLRHDLGYDRPLRTSDYNGVRQRIGTIYEVDFPPVAPYVWEGYPPHDDDPAWPCLFTTALGEEVQRRWHALHPEANAGDTDPCVGDDLAGATLNDRIRAEGVAREWLRGIAS